LLGWKSRDLTPHIFESLKCNKCNWAAARLLLLGLKKVVVVFLGLKFTEEKRKKKMPQTHLTTNELLDIPGNGHLLAVTF
jgi:hypothetical protein